MKKISPAKSVKEFDRRFDAGEDIHDFIDMDKVKVTRYENIVQSPF